MRTSIGPTVSEPAPDTAEGFAGWVAPHVPAMARLAGRLGVPGERDDAVQQALLQAWRKRHQFDPTRGTPGAWLLAITANVARGSRRRRAALTLVDDVPALSPAPDDGLDVERAIARLAPRQRLAVNCVYFADLTIAQTAAVMGCSEGTVKSTLSDARARLRPLLEVSGD